MDNTVQMHYARPLLRLIASLIDWFIMLLIFIVMILTISTSSTPTDLLNTSLNVLIITLIVNHILWKLLLTYMESKIGATPGKLTAGIRLVDKNDRFLSFKKALFRNYIGRAVSGLLFGLGYYWIIRDDSHQGWHDMTVNSFVVRKNKHGLLIGILTILALVFLIIFLLYLIILNLRANSDMYRQLLGSILQ